MTRSQATPASSQIIAMERMIEERDETIAAQAAVILKLREALMTVKPHVQCDPYAVVIRALSIPDDSAQVLKEWLDSVMGEPVGYYHKSTPNITSFDHLDFDSYDDVHGRKHWVSTPLFRKPEVK